MTAHQPDPDSSYCIELAVRPSKEMSEWSKLMQQKFILTCSLSRGAKPGAKAAPGKTKGGFLNFPGGGGVGWCVFLNNASMSIFTVFFIEEDDRRVGVPGVFSSTFLLMFV